jgi:hypothetical protein
MQAGQSTRRGGEIVFGRENGGDLSITTLLMVLSHFLLYAITQTQNACASRPQGS